MREHLTDRFAKTVPTTPGKIARYFDSDPKSPRGFLLRVTPAAARVWALRYRTKDGREREITIGDVADRPIGQARERARELRREVEDGGDPLQRFQDKRAEPTVVELIARFEKEALVSRAPRTQAEYKAMFRDWILPAIGKLKVAAVDQEHIEKLHRRITAAGKPRRANSIKSLCSALFSQAIVWKLRRDNPAAHVKGNRERLHERFLSGDELDRLMRVVEQYHDKRPDSTDAISLAVLTGARRGEILGMRWADLDLDLGVWQKPAELVKQRRTHRLTLSPEAVAVLRRRQGERDRREKDRVVRLRPTHDDHVFRGGGDKTHCNRLEGDWREIRAAAGLQDVRFHDLRHSVASWLIAAGMSLPVVGSVLGHAKAATTQRYAHMADEPQRRAIDIVGRLVSGRRTK
jgi:integrase